MLHHDFLFYPGLWLGKGIIQFSESPEELKYYTRWSVDTEQNDLIPCVQFIEIEGVAEQMENAFTLSDVTDNHFEIHLDNPVLGEVSGQGVIEHSVVAWEFRDNGTSGFEGLEVYELQENNSYKMHAEYTSHNQLRTVIDGIIWKKTAEEGYNASDTA